MAREHVAEVDTRTRVCVEEILQADAVDLTHWADASFYAALCLGPFYHLPDPADRDRAAAELAGVLRLGGVVFVALMPRYALLRRTLQIARRAASHNSGNLAHQAAGGGNVRERCAWAIHPGLRGSPRRDRSVLRDPRL